MKRKYRLGYEFFEQPALFKNTLLIQIGRRQCLPNEIIEKHAHVDWYELTLAIEGSGTVITNDEAVDISKGDIYLSFPGDFHEISSSSKAPLEYDFISFNSKNPTIKKELKRIVSDIYFCSQRIFRDDSVNASVALAISEISSKKQYHEEVISSILEQVIYLTIRNFDEKEKDYKKININEADKLCFQIMHYINTHITSIKNLSALSGVFCFNYSYLSKIFKLTTGRTISDYYQAKRLDMAQLLIAEHTMKISEIAEELNYSSLYSFSKAFKARHGISPKHYSDSLK